MTNFNAQRAWGLGILVGGFLLAASCTVDKGGIAFDDRPFQSGGTSSDGSDADADAGGGGGDGPVGTGGSSGDCENGALSCAGRQVQMCVFGSKIAVGGQCDFACVGGACAGTCVPETSQCVDNRNVQVCNDQGNWVASTCPVNQACVAADQACGGVCEPGDRDCNGALDGANPRVRVCSDDGQWVENTNACPQACTDGVCVGCTVLNDIQCFDKKTYQVCDGSAWGVPPVACTNQACVDDACTGVCSPETKVCVSNYQYNVCTDVGDWGGDVDCVNKACKNGNCVGICRPGRQRCSPDGLKAEVCNLDGQWELDENCGSKGNICVQYEDKFFCGQCNPKDQRCDGTIPQECSADGTWKSGDDCYSAGDYCYQASCIGKDEASKLCDQGVDAKGCFKEQSARWFCYRGAYDTESCAALGKVCEGQSGLCTDPSM